MKIGCVDCLIRQAAEAIEMATQDTSLKEELLKDILKEIAGSDWAVVPAIISRKIQRMIKEKTGSSDPYLALKHKMNRKALDTVPIIRQMAAKQSDPMEAFVRMAILGNLFDAGSKTRLAPEDLNAKIDSFMKIPLFGSVQDLINAVKNADKIIYLADNAGEIIFDRLLIESFKRGKITFAVRGFPVINDATIEDAFTAGIPEVADLIDNGSDAPGTILNECSKKFLDHFNSADLVIAKGQGNYESLVGTEKDIFFLLSVKCQVVSEEIGVPVGSLVIKHSKG